MSDLTIRSSFSMRSSGFSLALLFVAIIGVNSIAKADQYLSNSASAPTQPTENQQLVALVFGIELSPTDHRPDEINWLNPATSTHPIAINATLNSNSAIASFGPVEPFNLTDVAEIFKPQTLADLSLLDAMNEYGLAGIGQPNISINDLKSNDQITTSSMPIMGRKNGLAKAGIIQVRSVSSTNRSLAPTLLPGFRILADDQQIGQSNSAIGVANLNVSVPTAETCSDCSIRNFFSNLTFGHWLTAWIVFISCIGLRRIL